MVNLSGGKIYLDASVIIYATETPHLFTQLRPKLIEPLAKGEVTLVTSWLSLAEVLIKPLQTQDMILEKAYRQFLSPAPHFQLLPVDRNIVDQAAQLRAQYGFKLPDAIHIATGMIAGCSHYLTGDMKWSKTGLNVIDAASL